MNKKRIAVVGIIAAATVLIFAAILFSTNKKITVAVYGLSETETLAIKDLCSSQLTDSYKLECIVLNSEKKLYDQIHANKNIDIVFTENGLALERAKPLFKKFDGALFQKLPSVFSNSGPWVNTVRYGKAAVEEHTTTSNNEDNAAEIKLSDVAYYAYPLTVNAAELAVKKTAFPNAERTYYTDSAEIETMLKTTKEKFSYPLTLSGADNEILAFLLSVLLTEHSVDYASDTFSALQKEIDFHKHLPNELRQILQILVTWKKAGFLHNQWYDLVDTDVQTFLEFDQSASALLTTEKHIQLDRNFMENYVQKSVLLTNSLAKANIPARMISVSQVEKKQDKKKAALSNTLVSFFQTVEAQKKLVQRLHVSAVEYEANTVSVTSTIAGWVYAANSVIPTIDKILFETVADREKFFAEVRAYIAADGIGYDTER